MSRANCPGGTTEASQAQSHRCWLESRQAFIGQPSAPSCAPGRPHHGPQWQIRRQGTDDHFSSPTSVLPKCLPRSAKLVFSVTCRAEHQWNPSDSDLRTSQPHRNHGARVAPPVIDSGFMDAMATLVLLLPLRLHGKMIPSGQAAPGKDDPRQVSPWHSYSSCWIRQLRLVGYFIRR